MTPADGIPGSSGEILKIDDQEGGAPIADKKHIFFNGCGYEDADHETFELTPTKNSFSFCKTARKPYDLAVQACLLVAHYHAPSSISFSSDGDADEWQAAIDLVAEATGINFRDPACAAKFVQAKDSLISELCRPALIKDGK